MNGNGTAVRRPGRARFVALPAERAHHGVIRPSEAGPTGAAMIDSTVQVVAPPRRSVRAFLRWVAESCEPGDRVLDIGAGVSHSGPLTPLTRKAVHLVGVDPDGAIELNGALQERHRTSLELFAEEHEGEFDAAFAVYVLEHVADPAAFMAACSRVLRPGGTFFALTPNVRQYFGATTWALTRLGLSDRVLERLKGHEDAHDHHFPPQYRLNSMSALRRHLDAAGFGTVDFRCFDETARYGWYLPDGLRWVAPAYTRLAYGIGRGCLMGHLSLRAEK